MTDGGGADCFQADVGDPDVQCQQDIVAVAEHDTNSIFGTAIGTSESADLSTVTSVMQEFSLTDQQNICLSDVSIMLDDEKEGSTSIEAAATILDQQGSGKPEEGFRFTRKSISRESASISADHSRPETVRKPQRLQPLEYLQQVMWKLSS